MANPRVSSGPDKDIKVAAALRTYDGELASVQAIEGYNGLLATETKQDAILAALDALMTADDFATHEPLAEQTGAGAVLTFDFSEPVQVACVESFGDGLVSRAHASGTPTAALGTPCRHEVPTYLVVVTAQVKVWAPTGAVINVWGFSR